MASQEENKNVTKMEARSQGVRGKPNLPLTGLLLIQLIIGYEWLLSGIAKIVAGDFPSGLAGDLADASKTAAGWYAAVLNSSIIPNAVAFGYVIEIAEVLAGIALILGPLIWIFAWDRTPERLRKTVIILMIAAAVGGIFMAINFHIASGGNHPWVIPDSAFDEAVDVDLILSAIQIVITAVNVVLLKRLFDE